MIWVIMFAILGAATLVAVLFGLIAARRSRRAIVAMHLAALVLTITSWSLGHMEQSGRLSLAVAIALEVLAWMVFRADAARARVETRPSSAPLFAPSAAEPSQVKREEVVETAEPICETAELVFEEPDETATEPMRAGTAESETVVPAEGSDSADESIGAIATDVADDDAPAHMAVEEAADETDANATVQIDAAAPPSSPREAAGDEICIRSYALLERPYHVTLAVLLASMKRGGARDARLVQPDREDAPEFIDWRSLKIGLDVSESPVEPSRFAGRPAPADWSDQAASAIAGHAAHIAIDVVYDHRATRATAVGAALRAHAALMEFAPVVGVWWDEGMRLLSAADVAAQADAVEVDPAAAPAACISRRRFELDGANTGLVMFDTLGLRAFGLPDGQVVAPLAEAAAAAAAAGEIAAHLFERGCDVPDGAVHALADGSTWHVAYRRSAFAPDREVIQLRLAEGGEAPNPAN